MAPILLWLIMVLCLLISVAKYLMGIILRLSFPSAKVKKDYSHQPMVSVLMPCYNEGRTVYETIESISKSNYPVDRFEVIAQDDRSVDDSYEWILKAQRDFTNIRVRAGRNEVNCGKARTVCNALQLSTADIIISIDSDCIFHPDAIRELTACFSESRIGSVGGRVGVRNPNDGIMTSIQAIVDYSAFQLYKIPENWTRSVCCISGCLFAIRRNSLLQIEPVIRALHWFGIPVTQGEDRFLAHQTLLRGYGTYINNDAVCWTHEEWKRVQEGDVVRSMEVLRQQLLDGISVLGAKLKSLHEEGAQTDKNLQLVTNPDTSSAFDFQISSARTLQETTEQVDWRKRRRRNCGRVPLRTPVTSRADLQVVFSKGERRGCAFSRINKHYQHVCAAGGDYLGMRSVVPGVLWATGGDGIPDTGISEGNAESAGEVGNDGRCGRGAVAGSSTDADGAGEAAGAVDPLGPAVLPDNSGITDCLQPDIGVFLADPGGDVFCGSVFCAGFVFHAGRNPRGHDGTARGVGARGTGGAVRLAFGGPVDCRGATRNADVGT